MDNRELLQKADLVLNDLVSGGGQLANEQSERFVRKVIEQPTLIRVARTVLMRTPKQEINKIGFGSRIMKPAVENTGLAVGDRSKPAFSKVTLDAKEVMAEVRIPYSVFEEAVEQASLGMERDGNQGTALAGQLRDTFVDLIADRAATDLEELAIQGDTASGDPYLAVLDGWLKQVTANQVNVGGAKLTKGHFANGLRTMPHKYKRELMRMRHFVAPNAEIDYREYLSDRATGLGDATINGTAPVFGMGVPVQGVHMMPAAAGLLVDPRNLIFGIFREVMMEFEKLISERVYKIVVTARIDVKIEEVEAVVEYTNIG